MKQENEKAREPIGVCDECGAHYWKVVRVTSEVDGGLQISIRYLIECECSHVWRWLAKQ